MEQFVSRKRELERILKCNTLITIFHFTGEVWFQKNVPNTTRASYLHMLSVGKDKVLTSAIPPLVAPLSRQSHDHTSGGASRGRVLPPASTVPSTKLHKLENPSTEKYLLSKERSDTRRAYYILEVHTGCKRPVHPPDSPDISPAESSEDPGPQVLPFNLDCTLHRNLMEPKYGAIVWVVFFLFKRKSCR